MVWSPPKTWRDNEDRTNAANLNQYVRDNQLALRADAASLAQRVSALEARGFTPSVFRNVSVTTANRAILTDLTPPAGTQKIYMAFQRDADGYWEDGFLLDFAVWNAFAELAEGDRMDGSNSWLVGSRHDTINLRRFIGKGTGGVLAFSAEFTSGSLETERIEVSWFS